MNYISDRDPGDERPDSLGTTERDTTTTTERQTRPVPLAEQIHAAYAAAPDDVTILGDALQACDRGEDYLQGKNTYAWYWAIGRVLQPRTIAEIGVRFGYSGVAMAKGCGHLDTFIGFDNETYVPGCLDIAQRNLAPVTAYEPALFRINTQNDDLTSEQLGGCIRTGPGNDRTLADLFHIDGDHTSLGSLRDMKHAEHLTWPGGFVLIDDIDWHPDVKYSADRWCARLGVTPIYLPTFRGAYLVTMPA